jgi:hypothetical protein
MIANRKSRRPRSESGMPLSRMRCRMWNLGKPRSYDLVFAMLLDTARLIEDFHRDSRRIADVYSRRARIEEGRSQSASPKLDGKPLFGSCIERDLLGSALHGQLYATRTMVCADVSHCRRQDIRYVSRCWISSRETRRFLPEERQKRRSAVTTWFTQQKKRKCCESPREAIFHLSR